MRPLAILLLILSLPVWTQSVHVDVLPRELDTRIHAILDAIFRLDYDRADRLCNELIQANPKHPAGHVFLVRSYWSRALNNTRLLSVEEFAAEQFFSKPPIPMDKEFESRFDQASDRAIEIAKQWQKDHPSDQGARYLLGVAYQTKASYEFSIRRKWWRSVSLGDRALKLHQALLVENPNLFDAYITIGGFHYAAGSLPWGLKPFAFCLGFKGSREEGKREIEITATRGDLAADDARALLAVLYRRDGELENAAATLRVLDTKYPENYAFPLDLAAIYQVQKKPSEALRLYQRVLEAKHPGLERGPILVRMGATARAVGDLDASARYLQQVLSEASNAPSVRAAAHLELGRTFDLQGKRDDAIRHYKMVAGGPDVSELREEADRLIRRPFVESR